MKKNDNHIFPSISNYLNDPPSARAGTPAAPIS